MAHIARDWESSPDGRTPAWKAILLSVRNALFRLAEYASEDGSDLSRKNCASETTDRAAASDKYGEEIAAYVRSIIENGYFEEDSGKRIFVPWYIRSQLISEIHRHF